MTPTVIAVLITVAIFAVANVGMASAYVFVIWYKARAINQLNATHAARYLMLRNYLDGMRTTPRVCKFCSTIGDKHMDKCPYVIISFALTQSESIGQ